MIAKHKPKYGFFRNIVEAYEKDPDIINQKFGIRHETILHRAALHRRIEMVVFLLDHGAKQTGKIINLSIEFEKKSYNNVNRLQVHSRSISTFILRFLKERTGLTL